MKIIVFLVLAGLSLAAPGITDTNPDTRLKDVSNGLKKSPHLMRKLGIFTCNYKSNFDDNAANFENGVNALRSTSDGLDLFSILADLLRKLLGDLTAQEPVITPSLAPQIFKTGHWAQTVE
ncbi:uncharacterized protein ACNLHF_027429 isoform 2-T2 [Anomaloglossus baeobatrachus]